MNNNNRQTNNRRRGRSNTGNNRPQGNNNNRSGVDYQNLIDNRARGNASQMLEKFRKLASDAQMNGDRVNGEYYLQFADHYFRVLADFRSRQEARQLERGQPRNDYRDDEPREESYLDQDTGETNSNDGYTDDGQNDQERQEARPARNDRPREERPRDERPRDERPREERPRRNDRPERNDRSERSDRQPRAEMETRPERSERPERDARPEREIKTERPERITRPERAPRPSRPQPRRHHSEDEGDSGIDLAVLPPAIALPSGDVDTEIAEKPVRKTRARRPKTANDDSIVSAAE
jgi:Domain of unknown function (DUF4167)